MNSLLERFSAFRARRLTRTVRVALALSLVSGITSLVGLVVASPATAAVTTTCTAPASGGTSTTFYVGGGAQTYSVACYGSGATTATYPTSIAVNTGALPSDATFPTTTPGCTQSTSGTAGSTSEHYILTCVISETPVAGDIGSYPVTFTATGGGGASNATSGTLTLTVANPPTTCTAPASGGTSTTFYVGGGAQTYSVACYGTDIATATYPSSITVNTGALPSDATFPTTTPGCTQSTSGSGNSTHYILTCVITETPVIGDVGSYPVTFTATGGGGASNATSGTLTLTVAQPPTTCTAPASGGTSTTFYVGGGAQTYSVACYGTDISANTTPTSITVNTGALPSDATFPTTTPGCTASTSGTGTATHYILTCVITETPVTGDVGTYPVTFAATGGGGASNATSGTLTLNVVQPPTTCTAPASGGTSTSFTIGSADTYSVACYGTGLSTATYPSSITVNTGALPSDATFPTTTPGCTQSTSGSGTATHYILTCVIKETPTTADEGTYHATFLATGGGGATNATSGTLTITVAPTAPTFHAGQYFNGVAGVPWCFDAAADTVTTANGGLPLTSITLGTTPAGVTNYHLANVNLAAGTAQVCGTISASEEDTTVTLAPVFTNSAGSVTGSVTMSAYGSCAWTSSGGTTSLLDPNQDLYQTGSQSAFGAPITNGETLGTHFELHHVHRCHVPGGRARWRQHGEHRQPPAHPRRHQPVGHPRGPGVVQPRPRPRAAMAAPTSATAPCTPTSGPPAA